MNKINTLHPHTKPLRGTLRIPGDKSVSHRAVMMAMLADGITHIEGFAPGADNRSTLEVCRALGIKATLNEATAQVEVNSKGRQSLRDASHDLDCGNSGTTMRLMSGILVGLKLNTTLVGDQSLMSRPMARVTDPLTNMGGHIRAAGDKGRAPVITSSSSDFLGGDIALKVASAQVKSALLFASMLSGKALQLQEPRASRDHTEIMFRSMGIPLTSSPHYKDPSLEGPATVNLPAWNGTLTAQNFVVPGDISSAAFLMVAAAIVPGSDVLLTECGAAPTRAGVLRILERANIPCTSTKLRQAPGGEWIDDFHVQGDLSQATPFLIEPGDVPTLVDEIPVLAVLAALFPGRSEMRGVEERRVKESDRLERTIALIKACGRNAWDAADTLFVQGDTESPLRAFTNYDAQHDHRMAAAALVASLCADGPCSVLGLDCLEVSYPALPADLLALQT